MLGAAQIAFVGMDMVIRGVQVFCHYMELLVAESWLTFEGQRWVNENTISFSVIPTLHPLTIHSKCITVFLSTLISALLPKLSSFSLDILLSGGLTPSLLLCLAIDECQIVAQELLRERLICELLLGLDVFLGQLYLPEFRALFIRSTFTTIDIYKEVFRRLRLRL